MTCPTCWTGENDLAFARLEQGPDDRLPCDCRCSDAEPRPRLRGHPILSRAGAPAETVARQTMTTGSTLVFVTLASLRRECHTLAGDVQTRVAAWWGRACLTGP